MILSSADIEAAEAILMSLISLSYDHPLASLHPSARASRSPSFLFGIDRGSVYFTISQRQIRRSPVLGERSRTGAGRVRPGGEDGPRCDLKPLLLQLDGSLFFDPSEASRIRVCRVLDPVERRFGFCGYSFPGALDCC